MGDTKKSAIFSPEDRALSALIGKRLKKLRCEKGLSHEKLSRALSDKYGLKVSSVSLMYFETDEVGNSRFGSNLRMSSEYVRRLADFYGVSADYILGISPIKTNNPKKEAAVRYTGLSEDAVEAVREIEKGEALGVLSDFLASDAKKLAFDLHYLRGRTEAAKTMLSFAKEMKDPQKAREVAILFGFAAYAFELTCRDIANVYSTLDLMSEAEQLAERLSKQERSKDNE